MEPPDAWARTRGAPRLLVLALLLGAQPDAQAEVQVSVPPLVEVMRGESVALNCTPLGVHDYFMLEWYLADRSGVRHRLASGELRGSEIQGGVHSSRGRSPPYQLDSQGRLMLAEAQVGDERDYVCVVTVGATVTAEATVRLQVFAKPEATEVAPNRGTLSVTDDIAQEIATCNSRNGNPAPKITWHRNGEPLQVPMEVNTEGYMTSRTVREASGLQSLTSTLYLRLRKTDRDASFHCSVHYLLPKGQHGRLDSPPFGLTLHCEGSPELRPEETLPKAEGSWTEGDEVRLVCSARGYPEPKLKWSQAGGHPAEPAPGGQGWVSSSLTLKVTSALSQDGVSCEASNPHGNARHVFHFGPVAPQTSQAGVAVMAVAISVGLLLLVVAAFYCMRRKGRPGCCRQGEKGAPPSGDPELSHSGSQRPEQTGLLMGGASGGARRGSGGFRDEC
uniref:Basal cell adhesion molecule (Lutheran blood group) n=1 Tax=Rousettus aegyptiacus TaxID=9407 RepID=A0A7J8CE02_ROUAE|nr:basal cell adhesion molecule (Lutheran blood group) [Rousettus aegyptiacus]